jgi:hypothetical protein
MKWKINNRIQSRKLQNNAERKMDTGRLSHMFKPILYILLTLSDDYPRPVDLEKTQTEK